MFSLLQVDPDSSTSILSETLSFWKEMNLSALFQEVDRKLSKFTSLTQVIFSRTEIVAILSEYIPRGDALSLQVMMMMMTMLIMIMKMIMMMIDNDDD